MHNEQNRCRPSTAQNDCICDYDPLYVFASSRDPTIANDIYSIEYNNIYFILNVLDLRRKKCHKKCVEYIIMWLLCTFIIIIIYCVVKICTNIRIGLEQKHRTPLIFTHIHKPHCMLHAPSQLTMKLICSAAFECLCICMRVRSNYTILIYSLL